MGAITLDLRPGLGVGPFTLGMPISDAFAQIERQPNICDVVHVNVKYFDEEPLNLDFVISFPDHGFHLHFDPWSHVKVDDLHKIKLRLRLIEIYDVKRLQLRCATSLIGTRSCVVIVHPLLFHFQRSINTTTFAVVYALFRPTFPRIYDKDRGIYTLFYPGLSFAFPIPSQYTNLFTNGEVADFPLEFPDGTTPVTCRVSIYDSSTDSKVGVDH
ncbi:hypothetical protein U9M48_003999 [Paspalum notatum var. saurae]|uniref:Uncharacterized protein n=1 Tax=Paspalum notatum var. saurae TaxID=547442 RepID=A0AAQ3PKF8_PASNO